jgi:hypothetical protein
MNLDPIATSSNLQTQNKAGFEPVSYKREYRVIRSTADTRDALRYLDGACFHLMSACVVSAGRRGDRTGPRS